MVRQIGRWLLIAASVAAVVACAGDPEPKTATKGGYKIGDPYQIGGIWYRPSEDYEYDKTGVASWYGTKFHGKPTANGEIFDMNEVSAAHNTLPMPSVAEVTNLENGRRLVVRVNDRGPFAHGRIIDLSKRAAELLGFAEKGTARVRVRVLAEDSLALKMQTLGGEDGKIETASLQAVPPVGVSSEELAPPPPGVSASAADATDAEPPAQPEPISGPQQITTTNGAADSFYVQAGAFRDQFNAQRLSNSLSDFGPTRIVSAEVAGERYYRVQLGPYEDTDAGTEMAWTLRDAGIHGARVVAP